MQSDAPYNRNNHNKVMIIIRESFFFQCVLRERSLFKIGGKKYDRKVGVGRRQKLKDI